jgi:RNA polymerase sigma-70 factor (ECF subfamily)
LEDKKIVDLFFERSEQGIAELSEKYGPLLNRIAENILGSRQDAEECVNDTYLAVWNTVPPKRPDPLVSYVCRIVRNLALKKYHANTAKKRNSTYDVALEEIADCFPAAASVEEALEAKETAALINAFLETLDEAGRVLFVRRWWYSESIEALAALFQTSRHNVSVRLSRIRKALKKYLEKEGVSL